MIWAAAGLVMETTPSYDKIETSPIGGETPAKEQEGTSGELSSTDASVLMITEPETTEPEPTEPETEAPPEDIKLCLPEISICRTMC